MDQAKDEVTELLAAAPARQAGGPRQLRHRKRGKRDRPVPPDHRHRGAGDGGGFLDRPAGRRHRSDEHYAGVASRNARGRSACAEAIWRAAQRYRLAVFAGGCDPDGVRGLIGILAGWLPRRHWTFVPSLPSTVPLWSVIAGFSVATSVGLFFDSGRR